MQKKKLVSALIVGLIAILMFTLVIATAQTVEAAPSKVKITYDANGGKIGTAKTTTITVKKDTNIGKLPKKPTRVGYEFKGWYSKKSGGTKITTGTKVKKKVTYYAQWKKSAVNNNQANTKKLIGSWRYDYATSYPDYDGSYYNVYLRYYYKFDASGKFFYDWYTGGKIKDYITGKYSVANGNIYLTNLVCDEGNGTKTHLKNQQYKYSLGKDEYGEFLFTNRFKMSDDGMIYNPVKFIRQK